MGRASLIGQPVHLLSPLVPSTSLLVGLAGVDFDEHQRFTLKWALLTALVLLGTGLLTTVIPIMGHQHALRERSLHRRVASSDRVWNGEWSLQRRAAVR